MGYWTVIRFALFFVLLNARNTLQGIEKLNEIYAEQETNEQSIDSLKCPEIEGQVSDCSECYTCDDEALERHRQSGHKIIPLKLNDANCVSSETICCVSQSYFRFREKENHDPNICGKHNPEGYPRSLRAYIRSVLPGEYPWRAWIYNRQELRKPLCAATFINKESRMLVTSASCVDRFEASSLVVSFDKSTVNYEPIIVERIDVHDDFDNVRNINDIAVVGVESYPRWAHRACLPIQPALHGTACIAVSNNDFFINQVIPRQSNCGKDDSKELDTSLMCGAARRDDFTPEVGGGMFCIDEQSSTNTFTLYGIYLNSARNGSAAINTNVTHFSDWITQKIQEFRFT